MKITLRGLGSFLGNFLAAAFLGAFPVLAKQPPVALRVVYSGHQRGEIDLCG